MRNFQARQITCLVADDDDICRSLLSRLLRMRGVKVVDASNGQEAVENVEARAEIAFVLMDLQMPKMDGYKATQLIRASGKELPIIAVTGATQLEGVDLLEQGFSGYFGKPRDFSELETFLSTNFGVTFEK